MSRPAKISPSATFVRHKLPLPLKIVIWYGLPVLVLVTLSAIFQTQQFDFAAVFFFIGGGLALVIFANHSGYRIAWDSEKLICETGAGRTFFSSGIRGVHWRMGTCGRCLEVRLRTLLPALLG